MTATHTGKLLAAALCCLALLLPTALAGSPVGREQALAAAARFMRTAKWSYAEKPALVEAFTFVDPHGRNVWHIGYLSDKTEAGMPASERQLAQVWVDADSGTVLQAMDQVAARLLRQGPPQVIDDAIALAAGEAYFASLKPPGEYRPAGIRRPDERTTTVCFERTAYGIPYRYDTAGYRVGPDGSLLGFACTGLSRLPASRVIRVPKEHAVDTARQAARQFHAPAKAISATATTELRIVPVGDDWSKDAETRVAWVVRLGESEEARVDAGTGELVDYLGSAGLMTPRPKKPGQSK